MFEIPEELITLGVERIAGFPVEGFVRGKGPKKPSILLIGEAPGENEAIKGLPFIGRAGDELNKSLERIGLTREDVYMTSAVRSRPYVWREKMTRNGELIQRKYNRPPTQLEIVAHAPILDYEIKNIVPYIIVTLENVGLQRLWVRMQRYPCYMDNYFNSLYSIWNPWIPPNLYGLQKAIWSFRLIILHLYFIGLLIGIFLNRIGII